MKIEKLSNNQIRCTLTKQDLADRELKLSELAYGSEKAKSLFRDMMQQASYEFGFEAEDIPLMIEAIPVSEDCIILTVTKVENPEELDTRFSKFSAEEGKEPENNIESAIAKGADEILNLYKRIREEQKQLEKENSSDFVPLDKAIQSRFAKAEEAALAKEKSASSKKVQKATEQKDISFNIIKIFMLNDLDTVCNLSVILKDFYNGDNTLYKNPETNKFYLVLNKNSHSPEDFNKTCNILSEYGIQQKYSAGTQNYYDEHFNIIIKNNAIQVLSGL